MIECIIDCLRENYAIEVEALTPLSIGADMNASIYRAQARGQSYFVKLKRGYENVNIAELLHSTGVQEIIPPIKSIHGHSVLRIGNVCLMIYPFIEGVNGFNCKLTDKQWIALGKALRQVHDFDVPPSIVGNIRRETYSPKWRQVVRSLYANESFNDDVIALKFLHFIQEHRLDIQQLVDRAEQLSGIVKEQEAKFVLCHSDIHGGNVLIKGNSFYIVDWDEPIMAPKERDLMFIGGGIANVWNDPKEEVLFYKGYGSIDISIPLLSYYRHERIVQDIAEYGHALLLAKPDKNGSEMYQQFVSMFDPNGVVDIAFKTDRLLHT